MSVLTSLNSAPLSGPFLSRPEYNALGHTSIFDQMTGQHRQFILTHARRLDLPSGDVWRKGGPAQDFCLLLGGRLRLQQQTHDGLRHIARFVLPGDVFEMPTERDAQPEIEAVACADCSILVWPNAVWSGLVQQDIQLANNTARALAQILKAMQARIREIATQDVEQRLANAMLGLVERVPETVHDGLAIDFPIGRKDFADLIGTTQTTVSRIVSSWEARGILSTGRFRFIIADMERLRAYAAGLDRNSPDRFVNRDRPIVPILT